MQTVILCGGLGTRLREETEFRPKPMVNVGARPILWHIMKIFAFYNHTEFILALGYKGEMIKDYFCHYELMNNDITIELGKPEKVYHHNTHEEYGWEITLSATGDKALKGSRLKKIEKYITGDNFMVTYGDGLADIDIGKLIEFHLGHGKIATVTGVNPASRFGEIRAIGNQVEVFHEKPKTSDGNLINGGFFVFNRKIFDYLSFDDSCDLEQGPLENIARMGELMVYRHSGFWSCMDNIRDMEHLNKLWSNNEALWKVW